MTFFPHLSAYNVGKAMKIADNNVYSEVKMKKHFFVLLVLLLALFLSGNADAEPDTYLAVMLRAAAAGDIEAGRAAERCRSDINGEKLSFDELYLLSRVIYSEAGSDKLCSELRENVGSVIMNRVDSPEFPDTLEDVIYQDGQYAEVLTNSFIYYTYPGKECVGIAYRLLCGERFLPEYVVFQANFRQGGGVYAQYPTQYGMMYFCISENTGLY